MIGIGIAESGSGEPLSLKPVEPVPCRSSSRFLPSFVDGRIEHPHRFQVLRHCKSPHYTPYELQFTFLLQRISLTALTALTLLFFAGHAHHAERTGITRKIPIQASTQLPVIAGVGFYLLSILVPVARSCHQILDSHLFQTTVRNIAEASRLVTTHYALGFRLLTPIQVRKTSGLKR